ncbi:serine/threonine-protein phosphatase [bacterium]|nr:serine/threonine-protein phosphatase [bacterium]
MGLGVGDVAGHGVPSALIMALCTGLFSDISAIEKTPGALLAKTNSQLSSLLIHSDIQYVTATYVMIYPTERRLVVARAGHPPAFIVHSNGETTDLNAEGTLLGMFPSEEYESVTYPLQSGDRVVLYTDGIIELRDNKGHELGIDFLKSAIISAGSKSIDEIIPAALTSYKGIDSATDDITLVVVEVS